MEHLLIEVPLCIHKFGAKYFVSNSDLQLHNYAALH